MSATTRSAAQAANALAARWLRIDALRGIAALMVLAHHAWWLAALNRPVDSIGLRWLGHLLESGWAGVGLFFTLSGFVLTRQALQAASGYRVAATGFWWRRGWRILPAYWLQLLLLALFLWVGGESVAVPWRFDQVDWWAQWSLSYDLGPRAANPLLAVWWTLPVELGFYLLFPWLLPRLRGRGRWALLALAVGIALFRLWLAAGGLPRVEAVAWAGHLPGRLDAFLIGMLAADALARREARARQDVAGWLAATCAVAGLGLLLLPRALGVLNAQVLSNTLWMAFWPSAYALCCAGLLVWAAAADAVPGQPRRLVRVLAALGTVSYGVYLWHLPVQAALHPWVLAVAPGPLQALALIALSLPVTAALAGLSWVGFERPLLRWARRRQP